MSSLCKGSRRRRRLSRAHSKGLEVGDKCLLFNDTKLRREEPGSGRSKCLKCAPLAAASRDYPLVLIRNNNLTGSVTVTLII